MKTLRTTHIPPQHSSPSLAIFPKPPTSIFSKLPLKNKNKNKNRWSSHHNRFLEWKLPLQVVCSSTMKEVGQDCVKNMGNMGMILPASEDYVDDAVMALNDGEVIAVPTDTLYGFACDACSSLSVRRIYEIKGRNSNSPLAICIADVSDINRFAATSHLPIDLLHCLLPGPVTLVLKRGNESLLEKSLNPGIETIGVRIPQCEFIRKVARSLGSALALTSANQSGQQSTVSVKEFEHLWPYCKFVFDGGDLPLGRSGSTIVDLTMPMCYKILRNGSALIETKQTLGRFGFEERF